MVVVIFSGGLVHPAMGVGHPQPVPPPLRPWSAALGCLPALLEFILAHIPAGIHPFKNPPPWSPAIRQRPMAD
jgi:hypothetical protein